MVITKNDGKAVTGVIVNLNGDNVRVNTDAANPFHMNTSLTTLPSADPALLLRFRDRQYAAELLVSCP